ncbi:hypothetical protein PV11_02875 [Exophiala sideris]|uniref:Uncharacterized protein n=1 Tax=Exophiala sideris TaxID=1016849 RepID=A0A0D1WER8_9EURO|nr:hypothetical protein PV11_02875 [Exophiala sideris]
MSNWFSSNREEPASAPARVNTAQTWPQTPMSPTTTARPRDPNAPDYRYQVNQKCIYERRLPGGSCITAHVQRLQSGYYDSPVIHEDLIDNVRFVAINFVFHPSSSTFRFKSAEINIALHHTREDDMNPLEVVTGPNRNMSHDHGTQTNAMSDSLVQNTNRKAPKPSRPKFLRHAPHLLYGSISPETLDWNFNLAGSLGVSQAPVSASLKPSYGVKSSYKIYDMMKIQGSVRTLRSWYGRDYDIEDGEMVWTLEENKLQKSGLPRGFTFVMLITKGSGSIEQWGDVKLELDIKPKVAGRFGASYPDVITNLHQYRPFKFGLLDLDQEIGQVFEPQPRGKGFSFANIATSFDDFVYLPGTTYSTSDSGLAQAAGAAPQQQGTQQQSLAKAPTQQQSSQKGQSALPSGDTTLNLRVFLESARGTPIPFPTQALPYFNLKPPSRNPSPLPASVGGSAKSTRRTITISSRNSVRKQPSRSGHSKEYTSTPADTNSQPQSLQDQGTKRQSAVTPSNRPFSYQEDDRNHIYDRPRNGNPQHQENQQPEPVGNSTSRYSTPLQQGVQYAGPTRQSQQDYWPTDTQANNYSGTDPNRLSSLGAIATAVSP